MWLIRWAVCCITPDPSTKHGGSSSSSLVMTISLSNFNYWYKAWTSLFLGECIFLEFFLAVLKPIHSNDHILKLNAWNSTAGFPKAKLKSISISWLFLQSSASNHGHPTKFFISFWQLFVIFYNFLMASHCIWPIKMQGLWEVELSIVGKQTWRLTTPPSPVLAFWLASLTGSHC